MHNIIQSSEYLLLFGFNALLVLTISWIIDFCELFKLFDVNKVFNALSVKVAVLFWISANAEFNLLMLNLSLEIYIFSGLRVIYLHLIIK